MQIRRLLRGITLLMSIIVPPMGALFGALTQGGLQLNHIYQTEDGSFAFRYPHVWRGEWRSGAASA